MDKVYRWFKLIGWYLHIKYNHGYMRKDEWDKYIELKEELLRG